MKWEPIHSSAAVVASVEMDTVQLYLPTFLNTSNTDKTPYAALFTSFLSLQLFVIFVSTVINTTLIISLRLSSLIHVNLKTIYLAHLIEYYFYAIAQTIIIFYLSGFLEIQGDVSEDILLILAGLAKLTFMWSTILVQTATVLERSIATKFIDTYEIMKSKTPGFLICVVKWLMSFSISFAITTLTLKFFAAAALTAIVLLLTGMWYVYLLIYNRRLLSGKSMYTLSSKYQVTENIRILKMVRNLFIVLSTAVCLVVIGMAVVRNTLSLHHLQPFVVIILELTIASFPMQVLVIIRFDAQVRNRLGASMERRQRQLMYAEPTRISEETRHISAQESLLYFKQLNSSWSKHRH